MAKKTTRTKTDQQGRILEEQHFDLRSFKASDDGVQMKYYNLLFPDAEESPNIKHTPHPDLQAKMDKLKPHFAKKIGILEGWDFARENLRENLDLLEVAKSKYDQTVESCKITGLSFTGETDTYGVAIVGYLKFPKQGGSGISSGKISLSDYTLSKLPLGYEQEVYDICQEIRHEIYSYRFLGKKHQTDIETEAEKAEQGDMFQGEATEKDLK